MVYNLKKNLEFSIRKIIGGSYKKMQLTEQKLLYILQEARKLADNNQFITARNLVKEIETMLLQGETRHEKLLKHI